jgi:uncharacterized protein YidB (DUF937 family)
MPLFDNAVREAVPGGNLAKPLLIAAAAVLAAKFLGQQSSQNATTTAPTAAPAGPLMPASPSEGSLLGPAGPSDDSIISGLGPLVDRFQKGGLAEIVNSWIGTGQNQPIQPGQLGSILGDQNVGSIARQAGINPDELLAQLSKVLPGLVDKLTPNGRLPTQADLGRR